MRILAETRTCVRCCRELAVTEYYVHHKTGRDTRCKACVRSAMRASRSTAAARAGVRDRRRSPEGRARRRAERRRLRSARYRHMHALFRLMAEHYGGACVGCGAAGGRVTVDHVVPVSAGGADDAANVQPLCPGCNSRKGVRTADWRPDGPAWALALQDAYPLSGGAAGVPAAFSALPDRLRTRVVVPAGERPPASSR